MGSGPVSVVQSAFAASGGRDRMQQAFRVAVPDQFLASIVYVAVRREQFDVFVFHPSAGVVMRVVCSEQVRAGGEDMSGFRKFGLLGFDGEVAIFLEIFAWSALVFGIVILFGNDAFSAREFPVVESRRCIFGVVIDH